MNALPLVLGLLLTAASPLAAQTAASRGAVSGQATGAVEARLAQYYADYGQRLRDIYFAPSDARTVTLLSTATEEFGARRRALRQELGQLRGTLRPAEQQALAAHLPPATWPQEQQTILQSPAAAKLAERCRRNPALETAFNRFTEADLGTIEPKPVPTGR